jgi:hypothetical protein
MKRTLDAADVPDEVRSAIEELPDEMLVEIETELLSLDMESLSLSSKTLRAIIARHVTEAYVRLMNGLTMRVHRWDARRPLNVPGVERLLARFLERVPMSGLWLARRANLGPVMLPVDIARLRAPLAWRYDRLEPTTEHREALRFGGPLDPARYPTFTTMWPRVQEYSMHNHLWSLVRRFIYIWAARDASSCLAHLLGAEFALAYQVTSVTPPIVPDITRLSSMDAQRLQLRMALLYVILKHKLPAISLASWAGTGDDQTPSTTSWSPIREALLNFWLVSTDMRVDLGAFARRIRLRQSILEDPDLGGVLDTMEALLPPTDDM